MTTTFSLRFSPVIFLLLVNTFAFGQWEFIGSPQSCRPLELDVEGDTMVLLTGAGIYFSVDSADSWNPIEGPPDISLIRTMQFENGSLYVTVNTPMKINNQNSVLIEVYRSDDWGSNWSLITAPLDTARSFNVLLIDENRVCYFGRDSLYMSFDKGDHFTSTYPTPAAYATYYQHNDLLYARVTRPGGPFYSLLISHDFGGQWDTLYHTLPYVYLDHLTTIDGVLWKLEQEGVTVRISKSYDNGYAWIDVSPLTLSHGDVRLDRLVGDTTNLYVTSSFSKLELFHSTNGGATWSGPTEIDATPFPVYAYDILYFPNQHAFMSSADHGATLTLRENGLLAAPVTHIARYGDDLIVSGNLKTHYQLSGESTWNVMPGLTRVENTRIGILLGMDGDDAFRSTDGGITWDILTAAELGQPVASRIFLIGCLDNMMYVMDYRWDMYYSDDFGITWHDSGKNYIRLLEYNDGKYMTQHGSEVVAVSDNGIDWDDLPKETHVDPYFIADDLAWVDPYYFFAVDTLLLRLHKDSTVWEHVHMPFTLLTRAPAPFINTYSMVGHDHALMIAWYGQGVLLTEDYGETWSRINDGLTNMRSSALSIINGDLVLGVEGGVWRRALSTIITNTNTTQHKLAFTVAPNPASDVISIQMDIANLTGEVMFTLFDAQGKAIRTLAHQGETQYEMSMTGIVPGIYFLQARAGKYFGMKKIVKQ